MNNNLRLSLLIMAFFLFGMILTSIRKKKITVKYSLFWFLVPLVLLILVIFPKSLQSCADIIGFETISNMLTGIFIVLLFFITMVLTIIVTKQKKQITTLLQEVSILKYQFTKDDKIKIQEEVFDESTSIKRSL